MINGYSNMSAPPRSTIRKVVRPVGKQIVFDMGRVGLGSSHNLKQPQYERDAIIQAWVEDFVSKHKAELDAVPRPTGFMVGSICEDVNAPLGDLMRRYLGVYHVCTDPILTVAILGRVSGLIYVPHLELRLTEDSFFNTIGFPAKYFPQFGSAS